MKKVTIELTFSENAAAVNMPNTDSPIYMYMWMGILVNHGYLASRIKDVDLKDREAIVTYESVDPTRVVATHMGDNN